MHEAFDPEPIRELPADEPRTPMWLPAVGLALLVALAGYCFAVHEAPAKGSAEVPASSASASSLVPAPAAPGRVGTRP